MDLVSNLLLGFQNAVTLQNLLYCFTGVSVGTLIGVLPGMGPVATVAMLLPITYALDPSAALIMLAGIYYGAQYGGSTTAVLVNIPGEAAAVVTCIDGHSMAKKGRAGAALGIAAIGSFIAGTFATMLIAAFAPPLTELAFEFGPAEYFSLMVLGLVGAVVLANGSLLKAVCMIFVGLILGLVGSDINSGALRYTFGVDELMDGIDFVAIFDGHLRLRGDHEEPRDQPDAQPRARQGRERAPDEGGPQGVGGPDRPRNAARILPRHPAGRRRASRPLRPTPSRRSSRANAQNPPSDRATSAAWRAPSPPTTRAPRRASSRCSRSASRPTPSWRS